MNKDTIYTLLAIGVGTLVVWLFLGGQLGRLGQQTPRMEEQNTVEDKSDLVVLTSPLPESEITSPLVIEGRARGYWFFEATFPIILTDWDGRIIAEGYAEAVLDPNDEDATWMTEEFVPFRATLEFSLDPNTIAVSNRGALILRKDNPSGLPENDDALEITVFYKK